MEIIPSPRRRLCQGHTALRLWQFPPVENHSLGHGYYGFCPFPNQTYCNRIPTAEIAMTLGALSPPPLGDIGKWVDWNSKHGELYRAVMAYPRYISIISSWTPGDLLKGAWNESTTIHQLPSTRHVPSVFPQFHPLLRSFGPHPGWKHIHWMLPRYAVQRSPN